MIISASRRTDIPARYSEWFFRRLSEGFVLVRNPMNHGQVSRVLLDSPHVDGFVFWTKNPVPMMGDLHLLEEWPYYFQFTLNSYGSDVEPGVPKKSSVLIPAFRELSRRIGPDRVVWRYNPVMLTGKYDAAWHLRYFRGIASRLSGSTNECAVSFIDMYTKTRRNTSNLGVRKESLAERIDLLGAFNEIAREYGIEVRACVEPEAAEATGVRPARCIDADRIGRVTGSVLKAPEDRNQGRAGCTCHMCIDIGAYDTCPNRCAYCYANVNPDKAASNAELHDPAAPLLAGTLGEGDAVKDRQMPLFRQDQLSLTI